MSWGEDYLTNLAKTVSNLTHPEGVSLSLDDTRTIFHLWNSLSTTKSESLGYTQFPLWLCLWLFQPMYFHEATPANIIELI